MVIRVFFFAGKWSFNGLYLVEIKINAFCWRKVACKNIFGFVNRNAFFKTGILEPRIGDFELSTQLPSIIEHNS